MTKVLAIILLVTIYSLKVTGQTTLDINQNSCVLKFDSLLNRNYYEKVEQMPAYQGGQDSLFSTVLRNLKWPNSDCHFEGKVVVFFIIETNGQLTNKRIINGPDETRDCDVYQMVLNAIDSLKNWTAGKCNGENVAVRYILPIRILTAED